MNNPCTPRPWLSDINQSIQRAHATHTRALRHEADVYAAFRVDRDAYGHFLPPPTEADRAALAELLAEV